VLVEDYDFVHYDDYLFKFLISKSPITLAICNNYSLAD